MGVHLHPLVLGELVLLQQDLIPHTDLADVM